MQGVVLLRVLNHKFLVLFRCQVPRNSVSADLPPEKPTLRVSRLERVTLQSSFVFTIILPVPFCTSKSRSTWIISQYTHSASSPPTQTPARIPGVRYRRIYGISYSNSGSTMHSSTGRWHSSAPLPG